MIRRRKLLVLLSTSAMVFSGPLLARQLNHAASPVVVMPSGNGETINQDQVTTVDANGTSTTVYRARHRPRNPAGMSGYSTGSATTDAFTGALLGNIMGGIVSDQIGGRVKQNKQFQTWFPEPAAGSTGGSATAAPALPQVDTSIPEANP